MLAQPVRVRDLELHLGDHAERSDRDLRGVQQVAVGRLDDVAGRGDDPEPAHRGREAAVLETRAVRRGRDRAGNLLRDDVALVREPEPLRPERLAELADGGRGTDDDAPPIGVERADPREPREVEQQAVGQDDRRERMARGRDANPQAVARGRGDELADLVLALGCRRPRGLTALVPDPVPPHRFRDHLTSWRASAEVGAGLCG